MFTVCPKCTLTLAVTANDLRVGQGYVRCGRCSNVFNALLKLSEAPAEGAAGNLPELPQADPASTSQIHRAITAAAIDGGAAAGAAGAPAPARPAARPPGTPITPRSPASPPGKAAVAGSPAAAPSAISSATPSAAPPIASSRAAAVAPSAPAAPAARAPASSAPSTAAAAPAPAPTALRGAPSPSRATPPASVATAPSAAAASPTGLLRQPFTARSAAPAPPPAQTQGKEGDADALDQFELVLQTLGLNPDGEEAPLTAPGAQSEPTQTVENIVLEGEEVRQSEARVPDKPLDELDLFTRRLGMATGDTAGSALPTAGDSASPARLPPSPQTAPEGARPMARRLAERRARLAQAGRRSTDGAVSGDAALAAARAAGRDPGIPAADAAEAEEPAPLATATGSADFDIPALRATPPMQQRLWLAGSIALVVLLLAQFVNHWRDALAASPTWGHPVTGLYAALGVPLQPHWDLSAYEVRQQGAESEGGPHAAIRVRFSLANHAMRAQPVPLLRLTLLDRYGRRVAERNLTPADYWPKGRSTQSFLAADERVDTEIQVRDPSADSASFELDVCLPDARGGIHCAGDAAAAEAAGAPP